MKQILIAATVGLLAVSPANCQTTQVYEAQAQETSPPPEGGTSLMQEGAKLLFEGLRREIEPAMKDLQGIVTTMGPAMRSFLTEMGPALGDILEHIQDFSVYQAPEILPNGDIIMRKKTPQEMTPPEGTRDKAQDGEIET